MTAADRREEVLTAATRAFARGGFAGTSTDAVAKEAGVSQPYVVRIFGTKQDLFVAVFEQTCGRIVDAFTAVIDGGFDPESEDDAKRLGHAYMELIEDRDLLRVMMHGFTAGNPEIQQIGRRGMGAIFETLRGTGWDDERVRDFIAEGMLLNVLLSLGALEVGLDGALGDLVRSCLPDAATEGFEVARDE